MPGPRTTTSSLKTGRKAIKNKFAGTGGGVMIEGTQRVNRGQLPATFKSGAGRGFGYTGAQMGNKAR